MRSQRRRDTAPELALRRELFGRGLRYRVDYRLPGLRRRIDIAFPARQLAVEVYGCFWHACPEHLTWPKNNSAWWRDKLLSNRARDEMAAEQLARLGWRLLVVWEHENPITAADRVSRALNV